MGVIDGRGKGERKRFSMRMCLGVGPGREEGRERQGVPKSELRPSDLP